MIEIVTLILWDVMITLNMNYRVVINGRMIHVYDLIGLWSICWEYYIDDEISMLIDECLELCWLISWWWYEMWLKWCCFMIRFNFIWDHEIYFDMSFWWVVSKNSRCWNVLLCLLNYMWIHECDECTNGEFMIL